VSYWPSKGDRPRPSAPPSPRSGRSPTAPGRREGPFTSTWCGQGAGLSWPAGRRHGRPGPGGQAVPTCHGRAGLPAAGRVARGPPRAEEPPAREHLAGLARVEAVPPRRMGLQPVLLAVAGQFCWPPPGKTYWPLTMSLVTETGAGQHRLPLRLRAALLLGPLTTVNGPTVPLGCRALLSSPWPGPRSSTNFSSHRGVAP